ncbi:Hypothetical protein HDN1F_24120 [gamma proteobacterium HdN1]|nr:Hypothetical protein HDN1F_24120 [gamma proteobacterium HdN1]
MTSIIGSLTWAEQTGGKLTLAEKFSLMRTVIKPISWRLACRWLRLDDTKALDYEEIILPDTPLTRSALLLLESCASDALVQHAWRTYLWAAALAVLDETLYDPELLLLGALLHHLGATPRYHGRQAVHCFTLESAHAALDWANQNDLPEDCTRSLAEMITLHLNACAAPEDAVEAILLQQGVACDTLGSRYYEIDSRFRTRVLEDHPRLDFNHEFISFLQNETALRPHSRTAVLMSSGLSLLVRSNPFTD